MVAEIILVAPGSQGEAARQNAGYVARSLSAIGYKVREQIAVCETVRQLQQAVAAALARSHVLVTLGGLGKAAGYMTKTTLTQGLGLSLEMNNEALSAIRSYCHRSGEPYSLEDNSLAQLPRGSVAFPGSHGKIPGCVISSSKQHIVMLPETAAEVIPMFNRYVSPYLGGTATTTVTRTVRTYGVREQSVRDTLASMLHSQNPVITVEREQNEVLVHVTSNAPTAQQAAALCTPVLRTVVDKMGDAAYGLDVDSLQSALIAKLAKKELDIAVAEAGTDGMLTRVLTETPGGQELLRFSVSADDSETKIEKLGLKKKLVKKRGPVSEQMAVAMAAAAREKVHTAVGTAVCAATEESATRKCPVGLVYIAVCDAEYVYVKKLVIGEGDASDDVIIDAALSRALNMIRLFVDYLPGRYPGAIPLMEALDGKTVTDGDGYDDGRGGEYVEADDSNDGDTTIGEKDGKTGKVRKFIFTLAVLVFLGSAGYIGWTFLQSYQNQKMADELSNMFEFGDMDNVEVSPDYPSDYSLKFAGLWNVNDDVKAFINIPETGVKYPIVQSADNDYYLRRDFYEKSNQHGVPYFDFRVRVEKNDESDNMVVYGHNMTDGQIFGEIIQYRELDFYKAHPVIDFSTVYGDAQYKIFSVFITNAYENQGHVFDYYNFIEAGSEAQFSTFLDQLRARTIINTPVDVNTGDKLITLSTCTYEFKDARLVVVARKLRKGEGPDVDVGSAVLNPQPLYPDIWYNSFGGTKPEGIDGNWSTTNMSAEAGGAGTPQAEPLPLARASADGVSLTDTNISASASQREAEWEQSRREESSRQAEESKKAAEAEESRLAEESSKAASAAEASRLAEESRKASEAEVSRIAEESRLASEAEASRIAEESRLASEAEASRVAEEARLAQEAEEQARLAKAAAQAQVVEVENTGDIEYVDAGQLSVVVNGQKRTDDAAAIVAGVVQNEVGAKFNTEAIKAQAVAAYTFIAQSNQSGTSPSVYMASSVDKKVGDAVNQVIGQAVYYNGKLAFTPYHATSAGETTTSTSVWGGQSYPYLVSVDSSVDRSVNGYSATNVMTSSKVADLLRSKLGIEADGDPGSWFDILSYNDGDYVGEMAVCGQTTSKKTGSKLTGRLVRETVLNLRSANFTVDYDAGSDKFTFTTYGYGHGVGMSQNGANAYAAQGWSYIDILEHYYPGTTVR